MEWLLAILISVCVVVGLLVGADDSEFLSVDEDGDPIPVSWNL